MYLDWTICYHPLSRHNAVATTHSYDDPSRNARTCTNVTGLFEYTSTARDSSHIWLDSKFSCLIIILWDTLHTLIPWTSVCSQPFWVDIIFKKVEQSSQRAGASDIVKVIGNTHKQCLRYQAISKQAQPWILEQSGTTRGTHSERQRVWAQQSSDGSLV